MLRARLATAAVAIPLLLTLIFWAPSWGWALVVGVLALVTKRERSFMILLSVLLGAFVLYWTIGSVAGLNR